VGWGYTGQGPCSLTYASLSANSNTARSPNSDAVHARERRLSQSRNLEQETGQGDTLARDITSLRRNSTPREGGPEIANAPGRSSKMQALEQERTGARVLAANELPSGRNSIPRAAGLEAARPLRRENRTRPALRKEGEKTETLAPSFSSALKLGEDVSLSHFSRLVRRGVTGRNNTPSSADRKLAHPERSRRADARGAASLSPSGTNSKPPTGRIANLTAPCRCAHASPSVDSSQERRPSSSDIRKGALTRHRFVANPSPHLGAVRPASNCRARSRVDRSRSASDLYPTVAVRTERSRARALPLAS